MSIVSNNFCSKKVCFQFAPPLLLPSSSSSHTRAFFKERIHKISKVKTTTFHLSEASRRLVPSPSTARLRTPLSLTHCHLPLFPPILGIMLTKPASSSREQNEFPIHFPRIFNLLPTATNRNQNRNQRYYPKLFCYLPASTTNGV